MKNTIRVSAAAVMLLCAIRPARAESGRRTMYVGVQAAGSISATFTAAGGTFSNPGAAATTSLGVFNRMTAPPGFTLSTTSTSFTYSSTVSISVTKTNLNSPSFQLTCSNFQGDVAGITLKVAGQTAGNMLNATLETAGTYGPHTYSWDIIIQNSAAAQPAYSATLRCTALSN